MASLGLYIGLIALLVTLAFAWVKGSAAEREAAVALGVAWLLSLSLQSFEQSFGRIAALLVCDFALAMAFLVITIRHSSVWVGLAMLIQAFSFAVHAQYLQGLGTAEFRTYILILNLASVGLLLSILGGTINALIKRARVRRQAAHTLTSPSTPAAPAQGHPA